MTKPLIYLAEPSRILSKIIQTELEKLDYEVQCFKDGFSLLKQITTSTPNLIICDNNLAEIDGIEVCKILKTGSPKDSIPFILISADDSVFDFWISAIEANRVVLVKNDNIDYLIESVKSMLDYKYVEAEAFFETGEDESKESKSKAKKTEDEILVPWIVNAMSKSNFFFNMSFDGIVLVLDSQPAKVFISGTEYFDVSVADEFWNICKVEYEQQAKKNHTITYEEKYYENILLKQPEREKYESYRAFTLKNKNGFVGTLHLASTKRKLFNYKIQSSIEFILPALANILQEAVERSELALQESKLRTAFSKFVPEEVINDFLVSTESQELKNKNEKRNVVVLMSDIRSFTSISEVNKPEDVVNFLNTYFTHMVDIVKKYGGTVDKFVGDAIMVLFGAPISYNDNAKRAVQAAMEMYAQLEKIPCGNLKFPEGIKLDIGIGIHYGPVIVGQIGSADKTNYTVIGDTVNLASRLEGLTKLYGARIIISEAVRDELDESMNALLLDSVKVKGKTESVFIYRVDEKPLSKDFTQAYEKGFKSYSEGAFSLAIPYFEEALKILPQDKAATLMLERCNEFAENKPKNWDGAIALTSK